MSDLFCRDEDAPQDISEPPQKLEASPKAKNPSRSSNGTKLTDIVDDDDDDDDPIVTEIPIILKKKPHSQSVHILQYPNRPITRPFIDKNRIIGSRLKPDSHYIEVDIPIDTTKFYDAFKSEEWGGVDKQTLQGVLLDLEGYYAANVTNGELVLIPLDSTAQLRPSLKHIDKEVADKKELNRLDNANNSNNSGNNGSVQVVHMTVKNPSDNTPRLGGALLARKKVDEEDFQVLKWYDLNDQETNVVRKAMIDVEVKDELVSDTKPQEFIRMLVKDTISLT